MQFANDFHSWLRHSWKYLANRLTRDPKIVIHGNSCIILYVTYRGCHTHNVDDFEVPNWCSCYNMHVGYKSKQHVSWGWTHGHGCNSNARYVQVDAVGIMEINLRSPVSQSPIPSFLTVWIFMVPVPLSTGRKWYVHVWNIHLT